MRPPARALVVTVVHHPEDARIRHRQIDALLGAGWEVTYAAPFGGYGLDTSAVPPRLTVIDVERASGRRRLSAMRSARGVLEAQGPGHDVVLLHDPELLLAARGLDLPPVVWDVHEDTAAAVSMKPWLPAGLAAPAAWALRRVERRAERKVHLLLAEDAYQDRFRKPHPVVPNTTRVPDEPLSPDHPRVVYVGHLTRARGVLDLIAMARRVTGATSGALSVELVGHADAEATAALRDATDVLTWHGFLPYDEALTLIDGSMAGLSLLHDEPNYRHSRPTKVIEYMARGVPVVTTPLPLAKQLIEEVGAGLVVPFEDPAAAAAAVLSLHSDAAQRLKLGWHGHRYAQEHLDWRSKSGEFVSRLGSIAGAPRP